MAEILRGQLRIVTVDNATGEEKTLGYSHEVDFILENIPGAWSVTADREVPGRTNHPGIGGTVFNAVADWFGRNCGEKIGSREICQMAFTTLLDHLSSDGVTQLAQTILKELDLQVKQL